MIDTKTNTLKIRRTKIIATLGPASSEPELIKNLINAGVNIFRQNFSHGDHNYHKKTNIKIPLWGSFAKVCTEFNIPDLTKNVPHILKVKVAIDKMIVQDIRSSLFSRTKTPYWPILVRKLDNSPKGFHP